MNISMRLLVFALFAQGAFQGLQGAASSGVTADAQAQRVVRLATDYLRAEEARRRVLGIRGVVSLSDDVSRQILNVPARASASDIKTAWRKLNLFFHPDRFPGDKDLGDQAFKYVQNAYAVLSPAAQRGPSRTALPSEAEMREQKERAEAAMATMHEWKTAVHARDNSLTEEELDTLWENYKSDLEQYGKGVAEGKHLARMRARAEGPEIARARAEAEKFAREEAIRRAELEAAQKRQAEQEAAQKRAAAEAEREVAIERERARRANQEWQERQEKERFVEIERNRAIEEIQEAAKTGMGKPLMLFIAKKLVALKFKNITISLRRFDPIFQDQVLKAKYEDYGLKAPQEVLASYYFALLPRKMQRDRFLKLPDELKHYFKGISIQDLIDAEAITEEDIIEKREYFSATRTTRTLDLHGLHINNIENLKDVPFIKTVPALDLSFNLIGKQEYGFGPEIPHDVFKGLDNLIKLDLSGNRLTRLVPYDFEGLIHLEDLDLSRNPIEYFGHFELFYTYNPDLKSITLTGNKLSDAEKEKNKKPVQEMKKKRPLGKWLSVYF